MPKMERSWLDALRSAEQQKKPEIKDLLEGREYPIFEKKRDAVFQKILQVEGQERHALIERVMEHNFEDGLQLAEKAKWTRKLYQQAFTNPPLIMKYPEVMKKIERKVDQCKAQNSLSREDSHERGLMRAPYRNSRDALEAVPMRDPNFVSVKPSGKSAALWDEIDEVYAPLLRNTQLENVDVKDPRTRGERMGENYLQSAQYLRHYQTDVIISYLYTTHIKPHQKAQTELGWSEEKELVHKFLKKKAEEDFSRRKEPLSQRLVKKGIEELMQGDFMSGSSFM